MAHHERRDAVRHPTEVALDLGSANPGGIRPHEDLVVT
jgi:hypothetical protein